MVAHTAAAAKIRACVGVDRRDDVGRNPAPSPRRKPGSTGSGVIPLVTVPVGPLLVHPDRPRTRDVGGFRLSAGKTGEV